jgi:hypothetical protein
MKKTLQREAEVAFSRHAQPVWFRLIKYPVLLAAGYLLWDTKYFWGCFSILLLASVALHLFYRYKTKAWSRSFGGWDYHKNQPRKHAP